MTQTLGRVTHTRARAHLTLNVIIASMGFHIGLGEIARPRLAMRVLPGSFSARMRERSPARCICLKQIAVLDTHELSHASLYFIINGMHNHHHHRHHRAKGCQVCRRPPRCVVTRHSNAETRARDSNARERCNCIGSTCVVSAFAHLKRDGNAQHTSRSN